MVSLLLATSDLGIRLVTETMDGAVVEFGQPLRFGPSVIEHAPHTHLRKSKGPQSRRKFPIRK